MTAIERSCSRIEDKPHMALAKTLSITNVNILNSPIKRHKMNGGRKNKSRVLVTRKLYPQRITQTESEGLEDAIKYFM